MPFDPIHRGQLLVRRAGTVLRRPTSPVRRVEAFDQDERAAAYERGERSFEVLAGRIERLTGCTFEGRTAIDYGCGVGRLALPLAGRCEHVYGLDVSPAVLEEADRNAKRLGLANVEWLTANRLAELRGRYDLAISTYVFQHIPSREGERIFSTIVEGLRPGGVGALHLTLRPSGWRSSSAAATDADGSDGEQERSMGRARRINWGLPYMLVHSYSLNRIARLLAVHGISEWHVKWHETVGRRAYDTALVIFQKD